MLVKKHASLTVLSLVLAGAHFTMGASAHTDSATKAFQIALSQKRYDSMAILPNGKFYATIGNQYIRASLEPKLIMDPGYPKPIKGNWGNLPASFNSGFDAMTVLSNGKLYVTKGDQYVKYEDAYGTKLSPGFPKPIKGNWGDLPPRFNSGFDAMAILPNGNLYVTRDNQYVKYTDAYGSKVVSGYPKMIKGNWGDLPTRFNNGFDSLESFGGKTYVTRNNLFVRYSDKAAVKVDPGFPRSL